MRRHWLALFAVLCVGALLPVARASDPLDADPAAAVDTADPASPSAPAAAPAPDVPSNPTPVTQETWDDQRDLWVERLRAATERVERARARHYKAVDAYSHMRARRRARGSEKQAIMDELEAADTALQEAETALGELRATARRAGVPPGWFRDAGADRSPPARPADAP